uniref:Two pore segment channel 3 n=1 Tax=Acanthochromis polyacanthus TaxID=80966 RepID=A0A3Q1HBA4_9TELE
MIDVQKNQVQGGGRLPGLVRVRGNQTGADFDLAAIYVSDAQYNRNIYFDTSPQAVRLYLLYNHWVLKVLLYFFILVNLSLALFEEPAVILLPSWVTMLVELLCLLVFTFRLIHYAKVIPRDKFWKDPKNICIIVIITLTLIDMIIYGALEAANCYRVRWSRVLRPLLLVNVTEGRQLRRAFRSIRNALPQIFYVFLLFMFSVLMFSLMALKLLGKRGLKTIEGTPYFTSYLEIVFDLYVLVTTANSPDSFFVPHFHMGLTSLYNYLEITFKFNIKLIKILRVFLFSHFQWFTTKEFSKLAQKLEPCLNSSIYLCSMRKVAFVQLADLLNIEVITIKSRPHPLNSLCPALYQSAPSRLLCRMVQHRAFVIVYDLIILVNAVFIGLDEEKPMIANSEWVFLALYMLEILLKLYVFEPRAFFSRNSFWNWFDTIIVVSALIATIINSAMQSSGGYTSRQILDIVFILRVLRLIRVVDSIKRFRTIINTLIRIGPAILTFGQLIIVVYYIFAMVGMELFKGKVKFYEDAGDPAKEYCGNRLLNGTAFAQLNYCKNNFNNVVSSYILLVELTVVNQCSGFATVTHVSARIFFVIFHIMVVIVIINIFVAFVLEAFFVEYSVDKSDLQTSLERKIEELELAVAQYVIQQEGNMIFNYMESVGSRKSSEPRTRGTVCFVSGYRTVDALLQRMFEADLDPEDFAEHDDPEAQGNGNFANPTFSST